MPAEWKACEPSRKRRDTRKIAVRGSQIRPALAVPSTAREGMLCINDHEQLRKYYCKAFEDFQQLNCRLIAKAYIKLIEPRKQVHFPYNGRTKLTGDLQRADPEFTRPMWWPANVPHREPDHLVKKRMLSLVSCSLSYADRTRPFAVAVAYTLWNEEQSRHHCGAAPRRQSS